MRDRKLLRPGGQLIVSVPNVANISVRLLLLLGRFDDYMERGILDRMHLRFFTGRTTRQILVWVHDLKRRTGEAAEDLRDSHSKP